ncbi:MAG TPA: class IV adenylate cyclase [Pirellulales bacterium]
MSLEVEIKFGVPDAAALEARVQALGAEFGPPEVQIDRYFNHPAKDFAQTDEAFRLRAVGDDVRATYKGPKLDKLTKMRREIELPIALDRAAGNDAASQCDDGPTTVAKWSELLEALGFRRTAEVRKTRREAHLTRAGRALTITLDDVERVGLYAEVETLAEEAERDAATAAVLALAKELGLSGSERRSYLEMLLAGERPAPRE